MGSFKIENDKLMVLNYSFTAQSDHRKSSMTFVELPHCISENQILSLIQWFTVLKSNLTSQSKQISDIQLGKLIRKEWDSA